MAVDYKRSSLYLRYSHKLKRNADVNWQFKRSPWSSCHLVNKILELRIAQWDEQTLRRRRESRESIIGTKKVTRKCRKWRKDGSTSLRGRLLLREKPQRVSVSPHDPGDETQGSYPADRVQCQPRPHHPNLRSRRVPRFGAPEKNLTEENE